MDEFVRSLERKWESTGTVLDGAEYLLALLRTQPVDLATFPPDVIRAAKLPVSGRDRQSYSFRERNFLHDRPIVDVLMRLDELRAPYWAAHQPEDGVPAFDRLGHWFAQQGLPEEQAEASQNIVGAGQEYLYAIDMDQDQWGAWPEYDREDIFHDLVVYYPSIPEIRVFTASEYADSNRTNIQPDWSSGRPETPQETPSAVGLLREFVFRNDPDDWVLTEINIIEHRMGMWENTYHPETWEELLLVSEWQPTAHLEQGTDTLPSPERRSSLILFDDLSPHLPFSETPRIERGLCEDYPACGHAERDEYGSYTASCPPRWSHTGRQVAMICATCRREMPLGGSSICSGCFRGMMMQDDPYYYGGDDYDEDEDDFDDDRAWYEHGDDYGY